ncbi:hypothetical protein Anapl_13123 [Anas platyrhynchos]|uniref:Uncharacterized protein n=1 Tax=Anas platyrhynchos TaxID=8839 RepID=R0JZD4_ANAPL|nr:hypothetical protein Anapl_13123 [Anas platyrhynchos]
MQWHSPLKTKPVLMQNCQEHIRRHPGTSRGLALLLLPTSVLKQHPLRVLQPGKLVSSLNELWGARGGDPASPQGGALPLEAAWQAWLIYLAGFHGLSSSSAAACSSPFTASGPEGRRRQLFLQGPQVLASFCRIYGASCEMFSPDFMSVWHRKTPVPSPGNKIVLFTDVFLPEKRGCSIWTGGECGTAPFGFGSGNGKGNACRSYGLRDCTVPQPRGHLAHGFMSAQPKPRRGRGLGASSAPAVSGEEGAKQVEESGKKTADQTNTL